jgi:hypothetical protein
MAIWFPEEAVKIIGQSLKSYEHRSDETRRWIRLQFCSLCGTTVTHTAEFLPGLRAITGGTFDDPSWVKIERHIWMRSALPWVTVPVDVPVFPKAAPPPAKSTV